MDRHHHQVQLQLETMDGMNGKVRLMLLVARLFLFNRYTDTPGLWLLRQVMVDSPLNYVMFRRSLSFDSRA